MEKTRNMKLQPLLSLCVYFSAMLIAVSRDAEPLDIGSRRYGQTYNNSDVARNITRTILHHETHNSIDLARCAYCC